MKMNVNMWLVLTWVTAILPVAVLAQGTAVWEVRTAAPSAKAERGMTGHDGNRAAAIDSFIEKMKTENPEEFKRLQELRQNDLNAFHKEMRARWQKKSGEVREDGHRADNRTGTLLPEELACQEAARKYRAARTSEEAALLKAELATAVERAFDAKSADQEARMKKAAELLAKRQVRKAEICAKRVEELTKERTAHPGKAANRELRKERGVAGKPTPTTAQVPGGE